eukprot:COSAG05_NODE_2855_length_2569_cov_10.045352_2_plen_320_part_00
MQGLSSWESSDGVLRISQDAKNWVEFETDEGPQICQQILNVAQALVKQKKQDAKDKEQARKEAIKAKVKAGTKEFTVTHTFWKHKIDGNKVPEEVLLTISDDGIKFTFEVDNTVRLVDTLDIQDIVSWETLKNPDRFRLTVKAGSLDSNLHYAGALDFDTVESEAIKAILLKVAQALAAKKRVEKAEKKRRDKEKEEEEARLAMLLEDTVSQQIIETHDETLPDTAIVAPYAAFDSVASLPKGATVPTAPKSWAAAIKKAGSSEDEGALTKLLLDIAWVETKLSAAECMLLTEMLATKEKKGTLTSRVLLHPSYTCIVL